MKTFGEMMALAAMEKRKAANCHVVLCPLCGRKLEDSGSGAYFCPEEEHHQAWLEERMAMGKAYEYQRRGGILTMRDLDSGRSNPESYNPDGQGFVLAISEDGKWIFSTTRGRYGRTSFSVRHAHLNDEDVPPEGITWVFAEWTQTEGARK